MTDDEMLAAAILDRLYDAGTDSLTFGEDVDDPDDARQLRQVLSLLGDAGLIDHAETLGGQQTAELTAAGRLEVQSRRTRRDDPAARAAACRAAVLRWLHGNYLTDHSPSPAAFIHSPLARYEGSMFSAMETQIALRYLHGKNLVKGQVQADGELCFADITPAGVDCVERFGGDIAAYEHATTASVTYNQLDLRDSRIGAVAAGVDGPVMQAVSMMTDTPMAQVVQLVAALRQTTPVLGLDEATCHRLVDLLEELDRRAAAPAAEPGRIRVLLGRCGDLLDAVARPTALVATLADNIKRLLALF